MSTGTSDHDGRYTLACLEVWGGNEPVERGVSLPGLDARVYSRPIGGAGGDVHYVSSCASGHFARILLADVSGHGAAVAPLARTLRTLMQRHANDHDQARLVRGLSDEFAEVAELGRFATAVVATFSARTGDLVLCNAGHPRPLLYRAAQRRWTAIDPGAGGREGEIANIPLGISVPASYHQVRVRLRPGDLVLMHTDALSEAVGPSGAQLGQAGVIEVAGSVDPASPERFLGAMLERLAERGAAPWQDDLTMLLLHANGSRPSESVGTYLKAAARLVRWKWMMMREWRG